MDHSHMDSLAVIVGTPNAYSVGTALIFIGMMLFYTLRAFFPDTVRSCCGYYSPWQEVAHGLCALGMVAMSVPKYFLVIPPLWWVILFVTLGLFYLVELLTKEPASKPSTRWCLIHAGIFLGMAYMFWGPIWASVTWGFILFYGYVSVFFAREFTETIAVRPITPLSLGVDAFHFSMGIAMTLMFLFPETFMPNMPMCVSKI